MPADTMDKETRNRAKAVNFGIVYGISPFGLAAQLGIPQNEARSCISKPISRAMQGVRAYIDRVLEETRSEQQVRTLFGRVRPIPDIQSRNAEPARICRAHRGEHAAAGHRGGSDQDCHDPHRPASCAKQKLADAG